MKLRKYSTGSLIKNKRNNNNKISNNILLNKKNYHIFLKLPCRIPSQINVNKRAITSSNLNLKEKTIKFQKMNNFNNNSQKSLKSKSNSDLRFKTDIDLNNKSLNCSMNIFSNKNNYKNEFNKVLAKKNKIKSLFKNFSSRNLDGREKSFELLKISNENIFSEKKSKNNNISLKANNILKIINFTKSKSNFNSRIRINDKSDNKHKNKKGKNIYNNICGLLTKKKKIKNSLVNFSLLLDKYLCDSTNINAFQNGKENFNFNNINHNKYSNKLMNRINILNTNKNKRNNNRKIINHDSQTKLTQPKYSSKKKINLPAHPNSKIKNTEINHYFSKKSINLTESNILFENKIKPRINKKYSSKILVPINLKKKKSYKIINNIQEFDFDFFSGKISGKSKTKIHKNLNVHTEINSNEDIGDSQILNFYEGVEMGHFQIVKLLQENKTKILKNNG